MARTGVDAQKPAASLGKPENRWRVRFREREGSWEGSLVAYWEVYYDPISDNYTPEEISAEELLRMWGKSVGEERADGVIPIYWFVESQETGKFEAMPFQHDHFSGQYKMDNFLDHYRWPEHAVTGELLNWLTLPVADKLWNSRRSDKGGFIHEATGWKPSILQPYVYLPALMKATGNYAAG